MAIAKLSQSGNAVVFVDNDGNQFFTSVRFLQGLLIGRAPNGFVELKMFPNKMPMGKYRKSPVFENGETIPYEVYFKDKVQEVVDLSRPETIAKKRAKESYGVDDNVW